MCFQSLIETYVNTGLDIGLLPNVRQAITWNIDCIIYWRIYASFGIDRVPWCRYNFRFAGPICAERWTFSTIGQQIGMIQISVKCWTGNRPLAEIVVA